MRPYRCMSNAELSLNDIRAGSNVGSAWRPFTHHSRLTESAKQTADWKQTLAYDLQA